MSEWVWLPSGCLLWVTSVVCSGKGGIVGVIFVFGGPRWIGGVLGWVWGARHDEAIGTLALTPSLVNRARGMGKLTIGRGGLIRMA